MTDSYLLSEERVAELLRSPQAAVVDVYALAALHEPEASMDAALDAVTELFNAGHWGWREAVAFEYALNNDAMAREVQRTFSAFERDEDLDF